jgi:hypothetical protein
VFESSLDEEIGEEKANDSSRNVNPQRSARKLLSEQEVPDKDDK